MDNSRKIHLCRVYAVVAIICNILPFLLFGDALSKLSVLGVICTFELLIFLLINAKLHGTILNFGTLFSVVLYIFHFGQLVLFSFFKALYGHIRILLLLEAEDALYGFQCMHIAFSAICLGMVFSVIRRKEDRPYIQKELAEVKADAKKILSLFAKFLPERYRNKARTLCQNLILLAMAARNIIRRSKVYRGIRAGISIAWRHCKALFRIIKNAISSSKWRQSFLAQVEGQQKNFKKVVFGILLCTFPFKLFIDVACLYVFVTQGGLAAREWVNTFPNVLLFIGKVSLVGFAILLLLYKNNFKKQTILFLFLEAYILMAMVSGIRSENVGYMCVFALLYFASAKIKIKFRHVLLIGVTGICLLAVIVTVGQQRIAEDKSLAAYWNVFWGYLTRQNVIFHLLDTLGDTGYTAQCVLSKWLPEFGPTGGDSYILGSTAIIPNIPPFFTWPGRMTEASCFPMRMQAAGTLSANYQNIGGSLLGELFFNFGVVGAILLALPFGIWIGSVSHKCTNYIKSNHYYGMIWIVPVMFAVLYWVRHYFGGQIREMVWGPVICLVVMKLMHWLLPPRKRRES